ncbi:hypothetical protein [Streptomyces silvisoli]|uniref:Uncharacterized protein n=1 Tax=Streptomyces silvisoli TaxID=3034235 RepID=A0ABT5ZMH1_9ACTN|nr:hypothetical protein [Streptomyces silvisoli]MDF3291030.1 hypothetical protein [Streptomyces silvisoli]
MTEGPSQPQHPGPDEGGTPHAFGQGYGYPGPGSQQSFGPAYGYPPRQPQPQPQRPQEPDWSALAERTEAGNRRRRLLLIGGGVLGAAAIAGIVATAVIATGHHGQPRPGPSGQATGSAQPTPTTSFPAITPPPPPNPLAVISDARKDTAPITPDSLFPGARVTVQGRTYAKATTGSTNSCAGAAAGGLGTALADNGCRKLLRATYTRGGVAVTVGVAVFDTKSAADAAKNQAQGYVLPLSGGGVGTFCHAAACRMSTNSIGRYAYFTIAGLANGGSLTADDTQGLQSGNDIATFVFNEIVQRGNAQR